MTKFTLLLFTLCMFSFVGAVNPVIVIGANGIANNSTYPTLKLAFDAINAQADQTGQNIEIQISGNTTETASAVLTQPTVGSWNSLIIYPTVENVSISGNFKNTLIDLNSADNVTINGKLNKTGAPKNLTIIQEGYTDNSSRTIRFINDAKQNTITNCIIKGSCPSGSAGILFFSSALPTSGTGNDGNTISFNDISKASNGYPVNAIFSQGTTNMVSDNNVISNNNFFDLYSGATFYGVKLTTNNSEWTISNNNFYEPSEIIPTADLNYIGISITSGDKYSITNNNIGGSGPGCAGVLKKSNIFSNAFTGITVSTDSISIQGNNIKNIEWKNAAVKKDFICFETSGNTLDMGTTKANTISDISWENGAITGSTFCGFNIYINASLQTIQNNIIKDISIYNTDEAHGSNFYGIKTNGYGTVSIIANTIGGNTANSINIKSKSGINDAQRMEGISCIYVAAVPKPFTLKIIGNTIQNLNSNALGTSSGNEVKGINTIGSSGIIYDNIIKNLTASNEIPGSGITGIRIDEPSPTAAIICANNMITLGNSKPTKVYGIIQRGGPCKVCHNSIYLTGNPTTGSFESCALMKTDNTSPEVEFTNNILYNARSNAGEANGKHYVIKINTATNLNSDYNRVNFTGTGGLLGAVAATDYETTQAWSTATGLDTHSKATTIQFMDAANGNLKIDGLSQQDGNLAVSKLETVLTDIAGTPRAATTYAGAHESTLPFIYSSVKNLNNNIRIQVTETGVEINLHEEATIELYKANGVLIEKTKTSGNYFCALEKGVYIIKINNKATKFIK